MSRSPAVEKIVAAVAAQKEEMIAASGAAAANALGLTTQVPVCPSYLTSGRSRTLRIGRQVVELRHAPLWLLACPGEALRALTSVRPEKIAWAVRRIRSQIPKEEMSYLTTLAGRAPTRLAA